MSTITTTRTVVSLPIARGKRRADKRRPVVPAVAPLWPEGEDVALMSPAMVEDATAAAQVRAMVLAETRTEAPEAIARALTNRLAHLSTVSEQYARTVYLAHLTAVRCARGILAATGGCDAIMREAMREALADVEAAHGVRLHYSPADLAAVLD